MSEDRTILAGTAGGPTVIRPRPGGRGRAAPKPSPSPTPSRAAESEDLSTAVDPNPLVGCAAGLLSLASELRNTPYPPDPSSLRERLIGQVNAFDRCARAYGMTDKVVLPARYALCALLDEAVLVTPWGADSLRNEAGLLMLFHSEASGGGKFFAALERLLMEPSAHQQLLELFYLCLAMGFQGRYRTEPDGRRALQEIRARLYAAIRAQHGDPEQELSPRWRGVDSHRESRLRRFPLWVAWAIASIALLGLYSALLLDLHRASDTVFAELARLGDDLSVPVEREAVATRVVRAKTEPVPEQSAPPATGRPAEAPGAGAGDLPASPAVASAPEASRRTLRQLLADEIEAGHVEVVDRALGETVVMGGGSLFPSGQAELRPAVTDQLSRVAAALARLPGRILISGHTDSVPIRTLRFPSNQVLSQARADNVRRFLAEVLGPDARLTAEGRAATEPRITEDPRDARNRRVEITLIPDGAAPAHAG